MGSREAISSAAARPRRSGDSWSSREAEQDGEGDDGEDGKWRLEQAEQTHGLGPA
jgi:hypothetical protein